MNYVLFSVVIALSTLTYQNFTQNNDALRESKNAVDVAKYVDTLSDITKFENATNNPNAKLEVLSSSNYLVNPRDKNSKNITLLNKLSNAMEASIQSDPMATIDCNTLAQTGKINFNECVYISNLDLDLFDIDQSNIAIRSSNHNQAYLQKTNKILANNSYTSSSCGDDVKSFAIPKVRDSQYAKKTNKTLSYIKMHQDASVVMSGDNTGELSTHLSKIAPNDSGNTIKSISESALKRIVNIEKEMERKLLNESLKQANITGESFETVYLNNKVELEENIENKKKEIIDTMISTNTLITKDVQSIASNLDGYENVKNITDNVEVAVGSLNETAKEELQNKISVYTSEINKYENEIQKIEDEITSLEEENSPFNLRKINELKMSQTVTETALAEKIAAKINYENQLNKEI